MQLFKSFAMANTGRNKEMVRLYRPLTSAGFNIGTDVLSASLPIPIIWSLQMSPRTRGYLIGVLSLGYV
jgi:hypothetical protein